jgi:hypothetical protein
MIAFLIPLCLPFSFPYDCLSHQVRHSKALKTVLRQVLRLGNYLNGDSARGGAYGFKLTDLAKLVQVKSALLRLSAAECG